MNNNIFKCPKCGSFTIVRNIEDNTRHNKLYSKFGYKEHLCINCGYTEIFQEFSPSILKKSIKNIPSYAAIISAFLLIVSGMKKYSTLYYYGISDYFLRFDIQDILINVIAKGLLLSSLLFMFIFSWKADKEGGFENKSIKFVMACFLYLLFVILVYKGVNDALYNNNIYLDNNIFYYFFIVIISLIAYIAMNNFYRIKNSQNANHLYKVFLFTRIICVILCSFCIISYILLDTFSFNLSSKKIYDTVKYHGQSYAILTTYQNNFIIAPYGANEASNLDQKYKSIIFSKTYTLIPMENISIQSEDLGLTHVEKYISFSEWYSKYLHK